MNEYIGQLHADSLRDEEEDIHREEAEQGTHNKFRRDGLHRRAQLKVPGARTTYNAVRDSRCGNLVSSKLEGAHSLLNRWSELFKDHPVERSEVWQYLRGYTKEFLDRQLEEYMAK